MKRLFFYWIAIIWLLAGPVYAQMKFGVVPGQNSLVQSEDEAKIFCAYLEDRLDERITVFTVKDEKTLYQRLQDRKIDLAVVSNTFYHGHTKNLNLLANYTRSEQTTHKLLLIVPRNGKIRVLGDLKRGRPTLVLDEMSRSRISFLSEALETDPQKFFKKIHVSAQDMDTLSGLQNGTYDAACVEDGLLEAVKYFDPGLVQQVKVLKSTGALASDPVVGRKGLSADFIKTFKKVLIEMESDSNGQQILLGLKITRFLSPLTKLSLYPREVNPAQFRKAATKKTPEPAAVVKKSSATVKEEKVPIIEELSSVQKESLSSPEEAKAASSDLDEKTGSEKDEESSGHSDVMKDKDKQKTIPGAAINEIEQSEEMEKGVPQEKSDKAATVTDEQQKKLYYSFQTLGAVIVLFVLLLVILIWFFRRKRQHIEEADEDATKTEEIAPVIDEATISQAEDSTEAADDQTLPETEPTQDQGEEEVVRSSFGEPGKTSLVELRGELKTIRVPDLLQLMASCKNTGALIVQSKHDEKCLYFRNGKVCSASCLDKDNKNKLGSLLIKLGKITEKERARALALCAENSDMRLGKALVQIQAVRQEELREALRVQAEEIVYSLFVFPEGSFEFVKKEPRISPEEDLALDVMNLLMEGARRDDEWKNMRQAIPSMDIILKFKDDAEEKLNGTDMNRDQELTLSLVNGERSVREICVRSTMVDFEVCDFLYRLIKRSVLEKIEIANQTIDNT